MVVQDGSIGPLRSRSKAVFLIAAMLSPLLYALYTDHIWEDFFITFRHSRNLAEGKGLVYQEGERVHGFTSPLGVLLPAFCYEVTGARSYEVAIWTFRGLSIVAFAGAGLLLLRRMAAERDGRGVSLLALASFYVLEVKSVSFSVNGMETAFLLLFLAWSLSLVAREVPRRWLPLGASWAGLMWSRPDGCVLIASLGLADLLFGPGPRRRRLIELSGAAGVCTALYLPWFCGAWIYYGSPVPHTIIAKANLDPGLGEGLGPLGRFVATAGRIFLPIYHQLGDGRGWHPWFVPACRGLGLFCAGYWLLPVRDAWGRSCSLAFAIQVLYLSLLNFMFPWYTPPAMVLGLVVLARGVPRLIEPLARRWPPAQALAVATLAAIGLGLGLTYVLTTIEMEVQASVVERGNRAKIGRWLRDRVRPGEVVYLECVGYIGYFSEAKMADWPGLVSPAVVRAARTPGVDFIGAVRVLRPDWLVLRPWEAGNMAMRLDHFQEDYELVRDFDVNPAIARRSLPTFLLPFTDGAPLPGVGYITYDARFLVFKRRPGPRP